jgi:hypothetical protein
LSALGAEQDLAAAMIWVSATSLDEATIIYLSYGACLAGDAGLAVKS